MSKHRRSKEFNQFMQPPMYNPGNMNPNMGNNMNPGMNMPPNMNMGNNMNAGMNMPHNMNQGMNMHHNMGQQNMNQGMNMPLNMNMGQQGMGSGFNMNNPMQSLLGALTGMGGGNGAMPGNMKNPLMDMLKNGGGDMSQFANLFNALKTNGVNLNNVNTNAINLDNEGDRNTNMNVSDDSTIQLLASLKPFLPPKGIQAIDKVIELYRDGDFEE